MRQAKAKELTAALQELRTHTLSAFRAYERAKRLHIPYQPELNPPLWELGHIAWFQEYWIPRNAQRSEGVAMQLGLAKKKSLFDNADQWYDSAKVQHDTRWDQAIASSSSCLTYAAQTLEQTLKLLQGEAEDSRALYFYWLVLQHEAMHLEAGAYMAQALAIPFELVWVSPYSNSTASQYAHVHPDADAKANANAQANAHEPWSHKTTTRLPAQSWTLGSASGEFCFDNELAARPVALNAFEIDMAPVCWAQYMGFIAATGHRVPLYVRSAGSSFDIQTFGVWTPMNMQDPAVHLSWDDTQA
ncbi:MAG: DinB family protein, partial [Alcaligenaceae bacterium]